MTSLARGEVPRQPRTPLRMKRRPQSGVDAAHASKDLSRRRLGARRVPSPFPVSSSLAAIGQHPDTPAPPKTDLRLLLLSDTRLDISRLLSLERSCPARSVPHTSASSDSTSTTAYRRRVTAFSFANPRLIAFDPPPWSTFLLASRTARRPRRSTTGEYTHVSLDPACICHRPYHADNTNYQVPSSPPPRPS